MDTKLKNNRNFKKFSVVFVLIAMVFSLLTMSLYPMIGKMADNANYASKLNESYELQGYLQIYNYILAHDMYKLSDKNYASPQELFGIPEEDYTNTFLHNLTNLKLKLEDDIKNLHYFVIDNDNNRTLTNDNGSLKLLSDPNITEENMNKVRDIYDFYIKLSFNDSGELTISHTNSQIIPNIYSMYSLDYYNQIPIITEQHGMSRVKAITNMTFIYGIPKKLSYVDSIYHLKYDIDLFYAIGNISTVVLFILIGALLVLTLLIPYKKEKELVFFKLFNNLYFELKVSLAVLLFAMSLYGERVLIGGTITGSLETFLKYNGLPSNISVIALLSFIYWSIFYIAISMYGIFLKAIFKEGYKKTLVDNSILIFTFRAIIRKFKSIYKKIVLYYTTEEIGGRPYKTLIITLSISFIAVSILCSIWFFGILVAIPLIILIFYIIKDILKRHIENYNKLLNLSEEVCQGNFDAKVDDDLGILNPISQNIMKTSEGFKSAVEKEIRSERLKTELISNVSHDLKTPLTSIINYVDLMKAPNLDEDTKNEYLNILDKKSQRLKTLIEDLFEASKAKSGNVVLHKEDINIVALIKQTLAELKDKIDSSNLVFKTNFSDEKIILNLDGRSTFRIFENIFVNATKYAMPGSRVYLDIVESDGFVEIVCKNMSSVEMDFDGEEIVERFSRGDSSRHTEGSGLGLSITKSLVELQDGTFKVTVDGDLFKTEIKFPI